MLYVIYPDMEIWHYMLHDYQNDSQDVCIRALNQNCAKWQLAIRKVFNRNKVPSFCIFNSRLRRELKQLCKGDSVLLCDYADPVLAKAVSSLVSPVVRKHYWIWNPVTDKNRAFYSHGFEVMKSLGFELSTFDEADAKQYGMQLYNQFFRKENSIIKPIEDKYDFYFVGFAKNREEDIHKLKQQLKDFRLLFKIVHSYAEAITYDESVNNILQSRCVVEYVQHNQTGMTLRPLEAMFYRKKLITNNQNTVNYEFYCPENIFIIGKDSMDDLYEFIKSPYRDVDSKIVDKYNVSAWLNNFLVNKK